MDSPGSLKIHEDALRTPDAERAIRRFKKQSPAIARAVPIGVWLLILRIALPFLIRLFQEGPKVAEQLKEGRKKDQVLDYLRLPPLPDAPPYDEDQRDALGALASALEGRSIDFDPDRETPFAVAVGLLGPHDPEGDDTAPYPPVAPLPEADPS